MFSHGPNISRIGYNNHSSHSNNAMINNQNYQGIGHGHHHNHHHHYHHHHQQQSHQQQQQHHYHHRPHSTASGQHYRSHYQSQSRGSSRNRQPLLDEDFTFISSYVKYSLFFFNLIFWIIGSTLIALGVWSFFEEYEYNHLFKLRNIFDLILHISVALVFSGSIVFIMSLMGCLGALRENLCLIKLYSLLLLLLFVGEVIISSLAFIFPHTLMHFIKDHLSKDMVTKYREDSNLQNLIDIIQIQFKCCGISDYGYKDWSMNIYFNCTLFNPSSERCAVPYSCCRHLNTDINSMCGYNMQNLSSVVEINKYVYTRGCVEAISELVDRNMNLVAIICLGSALAQLFAMFLARSLQGQIFAQRARWM